MYYIQGFAAQDKQTKTMRRDVRVVEGTGLENQRLRKGPWVRIPLSPPITYQPFIF